MLRSLFSFKGRINRATMWGVYLFCTGVLTFTVLGLFVFQEKLPHVARFTENGVPVWPTSLAGQGLVILTAFLMAVIIVLLLAAVVKRLHDRGKSAWWLALFYGVPAVFFVAVLFLGWPPRHDFPGQEPVTIAFFVVTWLISMWYIVELLFLPGARGENRFGPVPKPN